MVLIGAISIVRGVLLFIIQLVAGIVAAYIVKALFQGDLAVSTTLGGGTTIAQAVIIEMILTAQLVFTIFMLAAEKHQGNFIAPVGIGLSLFIAELVGRSQSILTNSTDLFFSSLHILHPLLISEKSTPNIKSPRRLLDRRLPQPRPLLWPCRRRPHLPHHAMDLLGWSHLRRPVRSPALQTDKSARIRERESGSGAGAFGWNDDEWTWKWEGVVAG